MIEVRAYPFSGLISTELSPDDFADYRTGPARLQDGGRVVLGGDRRPEVKLEQHDTNVEVWVCPDGSDPFATLHYLVWGERQP